MSTLMCLNMENVTSLQLILCSKILYIILIKLLFLFNMWSFLTTYLAQTSYLPCFYLMETRWLFTMIKLLTLYMIRFSIIYQNFFSQFFHSLWIFFILNWIVYSLNAFILYTTFTFFFLPLSCLYSSSRYVWSQSRLSILFCFRWFISEWFLTVIQKFCHRELKTV